VAAEIIREHWPQIVLFAATPLGRVIAPMISYRLACGLTADCTSFDILDNSRKGEIAVLMQTRPALGGNVMATICTKNSQAQMATARPGVFKRLEPDAGRSGEIIPLSVELGPEDLSFRVIQTEKAHGKVDFDADIIVSGGKGLLTKTNYDTLLDQLIQSLQKHLATHIEKGASRGAVEQGFIDRIHQVGQTGTAVSPKVYLALGISGAIQHMIGVANAQTIFAVNNDRHAPIFQQCDYYMVGDVETIIPQLIEALGGGRSTPLN
jgi:electron transfer flavoprotein alpha subunit